MIRLRVRIERKDPSLPRFAVIPASAVAEWQLPPQTTVVEIAAQGVALGRCSLKYWDPARWSIDITQAFCDEAGVGTGDEIALQLAQAEEIMPAELARRLESDVARRRWELMTEPQRRMLGEHVAQAKQAATSRAEGAGLGPTISTLHRDQYGQPNQASPPGSRGQER